MGVNVVARVTHAQCIIRPNQAFVTRLSDTQFAIVNDTMKGNAGPSIERKDKS